MHDSKTLLITGAANGIGEAVTQLAVERGYRVIAADINAKNLASRWGSTDGLRCEALDVRQPDEWKQLADKLSADNINVDVLINVAGVLRSGTVGELELEDIDIQLDVNVKGAILGCDCFAKQMIQRGDGHLINVGSVASLYPTPGTTLYATSKFAIRGFSISAAGDLRPHGVAVTLFGPGPVKTDMLEGARGDVDSALIFARGYALTPAQVAEAILGPVLKRRPLEYFLPRSEGWLGKLSTVFSNSFLWYASKARKTGIKNFNSGKV